MIRCFASIALPVLTLLCSSCWNRNGVNAQPFSNIAVMVNSPLAKTDIASTIKVFRYINQTVEFDKASFMGSGAGPTHSLDFEGNGHPGKVEIENSTVTLNISSDLPTSQRTGIYTITLSEDGHNSQEELRVILLNQDTPIIPVAYSSVVQRGQGISLKVTTTVEKLRWRRDGSFCTPDHPDCGSCFGSSTCSVRNIQGPLIYECFIGGSYAEYNHAIMSIIVRDCDNSHWGVGCSKECPRCFNGGTCHDKTGLCQCPPGFSGDHCENVWGSNVFGQNGEYRCNANEAANSSACQGALICYPRPFGCICPAGYSGWNCSQECSAGKFGANCQQECHCADGVDCDRATGVCGEGRPEECGSGWKGVNCQVEDPCQPGIYGDLCTLPCSCPSGNDCQEVEVNCAAGCASPWTGAACNNDTGLGRIEITFVKVNPGIATNVTCTGVRNPILQWDDLVLKKGSTVVNDGQPTAMEEREYSLTKQWAIVTHPLSVTVECSIRGTNVMQEREVSFYELPSFVSDPAVLVSFIVEPTRIEVTWRMWDAATDRGDGPVVGFKVRLRVMGDTLTELLEDVSASTRTHRFDGLSPDSDYRVAVAAVREGEGGTGSYHEIDTFHTPCGMSAAPNLTFMSVTPRSVSLMAEFPSEEERNCNQVTATLQQSDVRGPWTLVRELPLSLLQRVVTVDGLIPCSMYRFRIIISSNSGSPAHSQTVESETGVEGHSAVQNLTVSQGATPATLRVTWSPPDMSSNRCPLNGFNLRYGLRRYNTCTISNIDRTIQEVSTEEETYLIENLKYSARYDISVVPIGGLDSATRSVVGITSVSAPSSSPQDVSFVVVASTLISASWGRIECRDRNGRIEKYLYYLDADDGSVVRTGEKDLNQRNAFFANLVPYTDYSFRVQAFTVEGPGPFSVPLKARTLEDVPPQMEMPTSPFGNTSSIQVVWQAPVPPHGVITDYDISYVHVDGNMNETTVRLSASDIQDRLAYLITDLLSDSTYSIKVRAYTSVGPGEFSPPLSKVTAEGIPSPPSELRVQERGQDRIIVTWNLPLKPQGRVTRYKVVYRVVFRPYDTAPCGSNCLPPLEEETSVNSLELSGLEPSTVYEVSVSAMTSAGYGEPAVTNATTEVFTDLTPASVGDIVPVRDATTAVIRLPLLEQMYATGYLIRVEVTVPITRRDMGGELGTYKENSMDYITAELMKPDVPENFKVGDNRTYGMYFNAPLNESLSYNLYVITVSSVNGTRVAVTSDPIIVKAMPLEGGGGGGGSAFTIILVILILLTIVVIVAVVVVKRRSIKSWRESKLGHRELTGPPRKAVNNTSLEMGYTESLDNLANGAVEAKGPQGPPKKPSKKMRKSINVADLAIYVKKKKTSKKETLYDEYESLPDTQLYSWNVASKPENKTKNRYGNIVPYDQSRVVLATVNDDPHSDYINASYIDGYQSLKKYIACHGPNKASVIDFWRMVWQENCSIVVMLTNLTEGGKKKCEKYWPDDSMKYGHLMVRATNRDVYSTCTISTFVVSMADQKGGPNKEVYHYHFTAWPDMKVPEFAGPLLDLLQLVRAQQQVLEQDDIGPMVVHCSAGVGRTGTFITLDAMLDMAEAEKKVNVFQFISQMRENRIKMVQVVEQYQFIFDALVEYFVIGNTAIAADELPAQVATLKSTSSSGAKSLLQEQYETLQLITIVPPPEKFTGGNSESNKSKNRFMDIIPVDTFRPYLMTDVGDGGTNYINASFLSGFQKKDKFLGTQMPLDNTIVDFWRMVCDYNSPIIVMLNQMDPQIMPQYWSDSEPVTFGPFTVSVLSCQDQDHIRYRQLEVTNQTSPTIRGPQTVIHLQCLDWSQDTRVSYPPHNVLSLVTTVKQILEDCGDGPITVHCVDGVGRTGVFCGVYSALEQLNAEGRVDVFQLVNKMRSCQPSIIQKFEQYKFIYECLLASMNDENIYENYGR